VTSHHAFLCHVESAVVGDQHSRFAWMANCTGILELLRCTQEPGAVARHPVRLHAVSDPPHSTHDDDDESDPYVVHGGQHCACVGNVAIACDTVRRDRGCSGGSVNGATVGFVLLAATFDDPENARVILLSAAGLVLIGLLIAAGTVWWWRSSEIEHPALGPLEVMGSRSWWKGDYTARRRRLEAARPEGAEPIDPPTTSTSDPVDLEAAALAPPREFDDLSEFEPEVVAETKVGAEVEAAVPPIEEPPVAVDVPDDLDDDVDDDSDDVDGDEHDEVDGDEHDEVDGDEHDEVDGDEDEDALHDTSAADVPRPIDPLLRMKRE